MDDDWPLLFRQLVANVNSWKVDFYPEEEDVQGNPMYEMMIIDRDTDVAVLPDTEFVLRWQITNYGERRWPNGVFLTFFEGANFSPYHRVIEIQPLDPEESTIIYISLRSPLFLEPGRYPIILKMAAPFLNYPFFGDTLDTTVRIQRIEE